MKRTIVIVGAAVTFTVLGTGSAFAAEATGCTTTYAAAMETDAVVNGPVHVGGSGGIVSVGPFTPSAFVSGAQTPTTTYVACL